MRFVRRLVYMAAVAVVTSALTSGASASASGGSWVAGTLGNSACSKAWGTGWASSMGGYAHYKWSWGGYVYSNKLSVYSGGQAKVYGLVDCYSGYAHPAYRIKMHYAFTLTGSGLSGCSVSFPAGFSCSSSAQQETFSHNTTCSNATSCTWDFGPLTLYAPNGGHLDAAYGQLFVDLVSSSGSTYSFSSDRSPN